MISVALTVLANFSNLDNATFPVPRLVANSAAFFLDASRAAFTCIIAVPINARAATTSPAGPGIRDIADAAAPTGPIIACAVSPIPPPIVEAIPSPEVTPYSPICALPVP